MILLLLLFLVQLRSLQNLWSRATKPPPPQQTHSRKLKSESKGARKCREREQTHLSTDTSGLRSYENFYPSFVEMDCWSPSLTMDDEFEKLVIRMNPPRYYCLLFFVIIWDFRFILGFHRFLFFFWLNSSELLFFSWNFHSSSWNDGVSRFDTWVFDFVPLLMVDLQGYCRQCVAQESHFD